MAKSRNKNRDILYVVLTTVLMLLIPLIAMQFSDEVVWTLFDFIFAGVLLLGTGLAYVFVARRKGNTAYRVAAGIALVAAFLLIWVNGAVGIIGSEKNPVNLMYFGVIAVGIIGAIIARLQSRGMALTLFVMAIAQMLVPMIALIVASPQVMEPPGVAGVFGLNAFFALLFVGSAVLFRSASATIR